MNLDEGLKDLRNALIPLLVQIMILLCIIFVCYAFTRLRRSGGNCLNSREIILSIPMAFLTGYVDGLNFFRYKVFSTMMVGNMMLFANACGEMMAAKQTDDREDDVASSHNAIFYASIIAVFMAGVLLYRGAEVWRGWSPRTWVPLVLGYSIILDVGIVFRPFHDSRAYYPVLRNGSFNRVVALFQAPVFGIVNAAALKSRVGALPWGTTGNLINLGYTLISCIQCKGSTDKEKVGIAMLAATMIGSVSGAAFAVLAPHVHEGFFIIGIAWSILLWLLPDLDKVKQPEGAPEISTDTCDAADEVDTSDIESLQNLPSV